MKKKIILSMVVTAFVIGTIGCGSSDTSNEVNKPKVADKKDKPNIANPAPVYHIGNVQRKEQKEFDLPTSFDADKKLDNGEDLVIAKDNGAYYMTINHKNLAKNVQFYIDLDSDSKTGYTTEGGAELLVENGQLYSLDENNTWQVHADSTLSFYNAGALQDTIKLNKTLFTSQDFFAVKAEVLDDRWLSQLSSPKQDTFPKTYYKVEDLTAYEDFDTQTSYISSKDTKANMFLDKNSDKIDILLSSDKLEDRVQVYIDSDKDSSTGLQPKLENNITMWANMGADYQITENSQLFKWAKDANSTKNNWIYVQDIPYVLSSKDNKKSIIMHLKKASLENMNNEKIKLSVITYDKDWNIQYAMPELNATTKIPSYAHN